MTLKITSRSPKSNQLFSFFQQCIYASLVKIHPLVQKVTHGHHILTFQSAHVALKIRSRSPKSYKLFPSSQQCIHASLVKIHQLVQMIMHGNEKVDADRIRTKNNISTFPFGLRDVINLIMDPLLVTCLLVLLALSN